MAKIKLPKLNFSQTPQNELVNVGLVRLSGDIYPIAAIEKLIKDMKTVLTSAPKKSKRKNA